ncbi:hypothetical protein AKJ16_DCAP06190 [Drosera capensis]
MVESATVELDSDLLLLQRIAGWKTFMSPCDPQMIEFRSQFVDRILLLSFRILRKMFVASCIDELPC